MKMERRTFKDNGDGYNPYLATLMGHPEQMNIIKDLLKPGEKLGELLMKSKLTDENELRDVIMTYCWLDEFALEEEKTEIILYLAGKCGIEGWRAFQIIEAATGIMAEATPGGKGRKRERYTREAQPTEQQPRF